MIMGFISFFVFMSFQTGLLGHTSFVVAFEFTHIVIFFLAIIFIIQAAAMMTFSVYIKRSYDVAGSMRIDELRDFINLHKGCGNETVANPVTWRNPKLLSSGGLVISERCYGKDEAAFKGLMDFVERADIPIMFEQYVRMAPSERLRLGLSRREAFAKRFDAVRIFERAGIGSLLRASSS